ncbi:MAG: hypothetical protein EZS28_042831, partial [Streblomastix strix]
SPVEQHSHQATGTPIKSFESQGQTHPSGELPSMHMHDCGYIDYTECEADKAYPLLFDCNGVHGSSLNPNICKCIDGYTPAGCTCSRYIDLNQLDLIPPGQLSPDTCKCNKDNSPLGCNCYQEAGVSFELNFALICLRSVPLKSNKQSATISHLKEYPNSYAFLDTLLNPPGAPIRYGKHAANIFSGLEAIKSAIHKNTFDFYEDIMILLNNLKDPHVIFTRQCVSKEHYQTLEAIARWADEVVAIFRNPITRMNYALMGYFSQ